MFAHDPLEPEDEMTDGRWTWNEIALAWTRDPADRERQACWQLLSLLDERITDAFVGDHEPSGLDTDALLAINWSETEREIAKAAASLYDGSAEVRLDRMARLCNDLQMERLSEAVAIYRLDKLAPDWKIFESPLPNCSAEARLYRGSHPIVTDDEMRLVRVELPCGAIQETVRNQETFDDVEFALRVSRNVAEWPLCHHAQCRLEYAVLWSYVIKGLPTIYVALRAIGERKTFLNRMRHGTDQERAIARELETSPL